jgi:arabinose-5-phosphate isomerase
MNKIRDAAITCLKDEAQALLDLASLLTDDFDNAVQLIYQCKGKLIVTGVGKSGHIGKKIAATLASTGTPSFFLDPLDAFHGDLGMIGIEDIVLAISNSGQTDELLRVIPFIINRNIPLIGMSRDPKSLLAKYSLYHINIPIKKEADPLNLAPTTSTTVQLAMGDAIACALIELRGFKAENYAQFHPGGSLGKRLLTKVKDVMHNTNLPLVGPEMKLNEAIVCMSKGRQGLVVIVDNNNFILGVVTDGDVRRSMQRFQHNFFNLSIQEIMTKTPKVIHFDAKIEDADSIMNKYKIHTLIVVDDYNKIIGIIDDYACHL